MADKKTDEIKIDETQDQPAKEKPKTKREKLQEKIANLSDENLRDIFTELLD